MSFSYQTTTISELMSQLDSLGGTSRVRMSPTHLTAVISPNPNIQHFSSSDGDYLTFSNKKKKYHYDQVTQTLTSQTFSDMFERFQQGFNVTVILLNSHLLQEFLRILYKEDLYAINHYLYPSNPSTPVTSLLQQQTKLKSDYYQWDSHLSITPSKTETTLTKIISKSSPTSQMKIITLSSKFLSQSNQYKTQLFQLLDHMNKDTANKSGKEVGNKLFMKKHKVVGMFIENAFQDSLNYLVCDCRGMGEEGLEFCGKWRGLANFSVRGEESRDGSVMKVPVKHFEGREKGKEVVKKVGDKQFEYCRKLERKTHKYSVKSPDEPSPLPAQHQIPTIPKLPLCPEQQIQVLKASHLIQISKYHQTIQSLNSKILILSKQNGVEQLCGVYEKEIMMLELKMQEMREDITRVCGDGKDELKGVIKRLNEEVKVMEKERLAWKNGSGKGTGSNSKSNQNKMKLLENKLKQNQQARSILTQQLRMVTNRLQVRQNQLHQLTKKLSSPPLFPPPPSLTSLSISSQKQLSQLNALLLQLNNGNGQSYIYIKNKLNHLFADLFQCKNLIIESNQFLMELQGVIEEKVEKYDSGVVMECNRWIRSFLMKCVEVKE